MIVASIVGVNLFTAALVTIVTLVAAGCLKTKHIYPALNLPVLIVIAAAFGVSQAMQNSGAAGVCACVRACMHVYTRPCCCYCVLMRMPVHRMVLYTGVRAGL